MYKGQKSIRAGIEDFLCPFTDMYIIFEYTKTTD